MISLLHPSRQRPERSFETCKKWLDRAGTEVQLVISLDYDDPSRDEYQDNLWKLETLSAITVMGFNKTAIEAINKAATHAMGDIFIVVSDDTDCPENWAVDLLKALEGKEDFVAKCPDGIQDWIITMPIMDRKYYNRFGYIYNPEYHHMFCDLELACVGDLLRRTVQVPIMFKHLHYSTGAAQKDALSERADATWKQGEAVFLSRIKRNFDLAEQDIVGKITNEGYLAWIQTKLNDLK